MRIRIEVDINLWTIQMMMALILRMNDGRMLLLIIMMSMIMTMVLLHVVAYDLFQAVFLYALLYEFEQHPHMSAHVLACRSGGRAQHRAGCAALAAPWRRSLAPPEPPPPSGSPTRAHTGHKACAMLGITPCACMVLGARFRGAMDKCDLCWSLLVPFCVHGGRGEIA